jgi:hypothetical protein
MRSMLALLAFVLGLAACADHTVLTGPDAEAAAERFQAEAREAPADADAPIVFLDGERVATPVVSVLQMIEPKDIHRIEVIKSCAAIGRLGPEAENGIILIYTNAFEGEDVQLDVEYPAEAEACAREFRRRWPR